MRDSGIDVELKGFDGNHDHRPKLPTRTRDLTETPSTTDKSPDFRKYTSNRSSSTSATDRSSSTTSSFDRSRASEHCSAKLEEDAFQGPWFLNILKNKCETKPIFSKVSDDSFQRGEFNPFESVSWDCDDFAAFTSFMQTQPAFIKAASFYPGRSKQNCRKPMRKPSFEHDPMDLADTVRRKSILDAVIDAKVMLDGSSKDEEDVASLGHSPSHGCLKSKDIQPKKKGKKGHVVFGGIRIHTHALELGDNPACQKGIPLTLGWEVLESQIFDMDEFEANGHKPVHVIPQHRRQKIAVESGHSRASINRVYQEVFNKQLDREASMHDPKMNAKSEPPKRKGKERGWLRKSTCGKKKNASVES